MPCWTVVTVTMELKNADLTILKKALENLGFQTVTQKGDMLYWDYNRASYDRRTGQITMNDRSMTSQVASKIKMEYSKENVRQQAKKFGWQVQEKGNKFTYTKR